MEYAIRDVIVKAEELRRSGKKILYLNIGDPVKYGFETPPHIRRALEKAVEDGANYYSPSEGIKELREAVADKERRVNGAQLDASNIVITAGISEAILFLMAAIVNPGDEVLLPGPCYSPYMAYAKFFEGTPITYRTIEDRRWAPDLSDIEAKITKRTRLIVIINPNKTKFLDHRCVQLTRALLFDDVNLHHFGFCFPREIQEWKCEINWDHGEYRKLLYSGRTKTEMPAEIRDLLVVAGAWPLISSAATVPP